jgi:hypothetical protein
MPFNLATDLRAVEGLEERLVGLGQNLPSVQKQLYRPAALRLPTVREPLFGFEDSRSEPVLESLPRFRTLFAKESRSLRFRGLLILP